MTEWSAHLDRKTFYIFYYNIKTDESTWLPPPNFDETLPVHDPLEEGYKEKWFPKIEGVTYLKSDESEDDYKNKDEGLDTEQIQESNSEDEDDEWEYKSIPAEEYDEKKYKGWQFYEEEEYETEEEQEIEEEQKPEEEEGSKEEKEIEIEIEIEKENKESNLVKVKKKVKVTKKRIWLCRKKGEEEEEEESSEEEIDENEEKMYEIEHKDLEEMDTKELEEFLLQIGGIIEKCENRGSEINEVIQNQEKRFETRKQELQVEIESKKDNLNKLQDSIDQETKELIHEMRRLNDRLILKDTQLRTMKDDVSEHKEKESNINSKFEGEIKYLKAMQDKESSKNQNLQIANSQIARTIEDTTKTFNTQIIESRDWVDKIFLVHRQGKKKVLENIEYELDTMKKTYSAQQEKIREMERDYNNLSRILNTKMGELKKLRTNEANDVKLEQEMNTEVSKLEKNYKIEKEKNNELSLRVQRSEYIDANFDSHEIIQLCSKIEKIEKQIEQYNEQYKKVQYFNKMKEKFFLELNWANQEEVKNVTDKLTHLLTENQNETKELKDFLQSTQDDFKKNSLPMEMETLVRLNHQENQMIVWELERLESLKY
ncbi:hypothetical protein M0812_16273 [Anaeramoeba flamelloides]|uniref:WW domain-containing protein n=1 Tax=Anaeramoeba flamelloides TaxID=1746091 RepID=A0AAV7ZEQ5_9EUKA|nr:hypothetical protein M0812_16273 [Anaeramoeba flamelloides]